MVGGPICVIGAGLSGLAALRALVDRGMEVDCFERGSAVGGLWRYENDSGLSAAYASLVTNASRRRMEFPSLPMPASYGDFLHHSDMAAYLESYAAAFRLERHIRFRTSVERAEPDARGWRVRLAGGDERAYAALVVASGLYRTPCLPDFPGGFAGEAIHSRAYRTPDRFAGRRVVVVGAGQSALDIAADVSRVAARTMLACRRAHHIVPRYLFGVPLDRLDTDVGNRAPLPVVSAALVAAIALGRARPARGDLPEPDHPVLEQTWPVVSSARIAAALESRAVMVKPTVERLMGDRVRFADGSEEAVDAIVYATGHALAFPFLPAPVGRVEGCQFPLYRRIVSPRGPGLYFIGILEPGPRLPAVVERQSAWLAALLAGDLTLPSRERMWAAIDASERRTRRQFGMRGPHTVFCDGHAYGRLLARDLRRTRRRRRGLAVRRRERVSAAPA